MIRLCVVVFVLAATLASTAAAIDDPPILVDFQVVTPTVDSQLAPDTVSLSAQLTDTAPGLCTDTCDDRGGPSQVQLVHPATGQRRHGHWVLDSGDTYKADIELDTTSAGGSWQVEALWLADLSGNRQLITTSDLGASGFDTDIQNDSAGGDAAPPALTDVQLSSTNLDATAGAVLDVTIVASDAGSGVCALGCGVSGGPSQIRYRHAATGQVRDGLLVPDAPDFLAQVDFPAGSAAGTWEVDSLQLVDLAGNRAVFDASDLAALGFTSDVTVTSASADEDPPALVDLPSFVPDPIDTTASGLTATLSANLTDEGTGICTDVCSDFGSATQVRFRRAGSDHFRFGLLDLVGGNPSDGSFEAMVQIPLSTTPGVWQPELVLLADEAGNRVFVPEPGARAGAKLALAALLALISSARGRARSRR